MELLGRSRRKLGGAFAAGTAIQCVVGSTRARSHHNRVLSAGPTHCQPTSTENIRHYCTNYQFPRTATTTTIITATNSWRPQYLYRSHVPDHGSVSAPAPMPGTTDCVRGTHGHDASLQSCRKQQRWIVRVGSFPDFGAIGRISGRRYQPVSSAL